MACAWYLPENTVIGQKHQYGPEWLMWTFSKPNSFLHLLFSLTKPIVQYHLVAIFYCCHRVCTSLVSRARPRPVHRSFQNRFTPGPIQVISSWFVVFQQLCIDTFRVFSCLYFPESLNLWQIFMIQFFKVIYNASAFCQDLLMTDPSS